MKALLLKDFYTMIAKLKFFLIIILVFSIMGGLSIEGISSSSFSIYFSLLIPQTLIAYDEQSNFSKYSKILPYTDFEIIFSKYLIGYLLLLLISCFSIISIVLFNLNSLENLMAFISPLLTLVVVALSFFAIYLPGLLILGTAKGRFITLILVFSFFFLMTSSQNLSYDFLLHLYDNLLLFSAFAILFNVISVYISLILYKKKKYL